MFFSTSALNYLLKSLFLLPGFLFLVCSSIPVSSQTCYPTDPTGSNLGNLCLQYPNPSINPDSFSQAKPLPVRSLPSVASPAGAIIIQSRGGSYWSEIRTQGDGRHIQNNLGDKIFIKK